MDVVNVCITCCAHFHPWQGRESSSPVCSRSCNGLYHSQTYTVPVIDRFWKNVQKTETCWLWIGPKSDSGYGILSIDGRSERAHRFAYETFNGRIPHGEFVCHSCDNPACVNPSHLWVGSHSENMRDMVAKNRHRKTPNLYGELHPLSKLTADDARKIREDSRAAKYVANDYGVSPTLIRRVRRREMWKHI